MKILLTGATGFIGRHIACALRAAGHEVFELARQPKSGDAHQIGGDFSLDTTPADWRPRLAGMDVVINAVGILRESRTQKFSTLHIQAPRALFTACVEAGVRKVIQISALGADEHAISRYHISKANADHYLMSLPLAWVVLRPSLVFGVGGASARLFASLASLPLLPLPGNGEQQVQPVHVRDLAELCARLVQKAESDRNVIAVVGPERFSVRDLLTALRRMLGLAPAPFVRVPLPLLNGLAAIAERFPGGALDRETLGMLERGNVAAPDDLSAALGRAPRAAIPFVERSALAGSHCWGDAARLDWMLPLLRFSVALVWIVTGILSLGVFPVAESYGLLAQVGLTGAAASLALYGAAALDLLMGFGLLLLRRRTWLWRAQFLIVSSYSVIIAFALPAFWLHPFGPLLKNIPLLALILVLHEMEHRGAVSVDEMRE